MFVFFRPGSEEITLGIGMCFPQSCSPEALAKRINRAIAARIKQKISVKIPEELCQIDEMPSHLRTIDWIAM